MLFFGAGFINHTPFLVTELMTRGSLQEVLANSTITLDYDMKLRFLSDAALGMRFLHHQCDPPRVHRDLKSGNLLVSDHWVVKVAVS